MSYTVSEQYEIQEAIKYLVISINQSGKNPKPVILHSIRMGMQLYHLDYPEDIVIGAILHDLLEDTNVSLAELKQKFGDKVARLVQACSFDESIKNKTEQYKDLYNRCLNEGKEALIIKIADYIDNLPYMLDAKYSGDLRDFLHEKTLYFIGLVRPTMTNEILFQELNQLFKKLDKSSEP
jgi:guanosine-3',5'-bis(diphosphate) 3'-pyrophosphohydrolase